MKNQKSVAIVSNGAIKFPRNEWSSDNFSTQDKEFILHIWILNIKSIVKWISIFITLKKFDHTFFPICFEIKSFLYITLKSAYIDYLKLTSFLVLRTEC